MMNSKQELFGFDPGYGAVKLAGAYGTIELPSHIATGSTAVAADLAGAEATERPYLISTIPHQPFWCGLGAHDWGRPLENMDYDRMVGSVEMQVLLYAAFTKYMHECHIISESARVKLYVGLPLGAVSGSEEKKAATVAAVRKWLIGVHCWRSDGRPYRLHITDVQAVSQTTAAYYNHILADDGSPRHAGLLNQEVGAASCGMNTIELQVFRSGSFVPKFTVGSQLGVRRLLERVNGRANGHYSLGELDAKLRLGDLEIHQDLEDWSRLVTGEMERVWGQEWRRFAHIILVGGGAQLLADRLIQKFEGKAALAENPVTAVAEGLYKFALLKEGEK